MKLEFLVIFIAFASDAKALQLSASFFFLSFFTVILDGPTEGIYQCLMHYCCKRVWPVTLDTLEKSYGKNVNINLKFRVWKHDMSFPLRKIILVEISGNISMEL